MNKTLKFNRRLQQPSEQMGFCVQCFSFIPINDIDSHCLGCMENKRNIECYSDNISFQLEHINQVAQNGMEKCEQGSEKSKFLIRIQELCKQIVGIKCYNMLSVKKLEDMESEVKVLLSYPPQSMSVIMMLTRLESLLKEKLELQNKRKQVTYNSLPQNSTARLKTEQNMSENNYSIYDYRKFQTENNLKQSLEFKRNFYSKCLEMKVKLPKNHPAQQILVQDLYSFVISKNYNNEQAVNFIKKCFREYQINQI
ncbi:unnamed protein product (macronuclear) [Paramecium tetraurelia]|uniref:Uncharacterized protein n=1 Tax=Paramecium tetraurelia TaxID=5888 RepID=A0DE76_PARTE|nr:uncharacterized protein GSPATT00016185001 [Paramecium tetraurelia]CAK81343.1 unnamed protein product [Paramecium tetraurelia]|eukprot:XP_001448740.1 hypothetical protein (macronuclear) [Paramecium tetraurelia strain d4-2]